MNVSAYCSTICMLCMTAIVLFGTMCVIGFIGKAIYLYLTDTRTKRMFFLQRELDKQVGKLHAIKIWATSPECHSDEKFRKLVKELLKDIIA